MAEGQEGVYATAQEAPASTACRLRPAQLVGSS